MNINWPTTARPRQQNRISETKIHGPIFTLVRERYFAEWTGLLIGCKLASLSWARPAQAN